MRRLRWIAIVMAGLLALAGCGGGAGTPDTTEAGAAADEDGGDTTAAPATTAAAEAGEPLDVWIMQPGSDELEEIVNATATAFQEETGASVNVQFVPWAQAHDQFVTAVGGGQVPDLAEMGTTWTPEFAGLGALAAIEGEVSGDYIESLVESGTIEGTSYGYPWYAGARALIYRQDIFDELGLEAPTTWEDITAAGETISAETELFPFGVIGIYTHQYLPMVWQAGGEIAGDEGGTWTAHMDSPEAIEALEFYKSMWDKGWSPQGALQWNSADLRDAFGNGDFAMMVGGGWDVSAIIASKPDMEGKIGTALLPEGPGGSRDTFAGGSHLVVFEESDQKELAAEFANFMLEPERVTAFTSALGFLPGTVSGVEASGQLEDEMFGPFAQQLVEFSRTYPPTAAWGAIEGDAIISDAVQRILIGDASVADALNGLNEEMNEAFAE